MKRQFTNNALTSLLSEVYKFLNGYSLDIMNDVFHLRQNTYNLRNFHADCLEIIVFSTPSFIGQINFHIKNLTFWLEKLKLARIIQKRIKKLALH